MNAALRKIAPIPNVKVLSLGNGQSAPDRDYIMMSVEKSTVTKKDENEKKGTKVREGGGGKNCN